VTVTEDRRRDGDVLHDAGKVREAQVHELASFVLDELQNFLGCAFRHGSSWGTVARPLGRGTIGQYCRVSC